jgi:hypothetical protein
MSDIYLVFLDNYNTLTSWSNRDRSVVLKANYWFSI